MASYDPPGKRVGKKERRVREGVHSRVRPVKIADMGLDKLRAYGKVFARGLSRYRESPNDLPRLLIKRPAIAAAMGTYETALLVSGRVDGRIKALAMLKASSLVGCPF